MHLTFRRKLFLSMLLLTVIPLMVCSVLLNVVFRTRMTDTAAQEAEAMLGATADSLGGLLRAAEQVGDTLAGNAFVADELKNGAAFRQQIYSALYDATEGLRGLMQFDLYDAAGTLRYSTSGRAAQSLPTDWGILYAAQAEPDALVLRPFDGAQAGNGLYTARLLRRSSGETAGFFVGSITEDGLSELLHGSFGAQNTLLVLDARWRPVFCSHAAETERLSEALRAMLLQGTPFYSDDYSFAIRQEQDSGLFIVLRQPKVVTRETLGLLWSVTAGLVFAAVILCVAVSLGLSRQLSEPIGRLNEAIAAVELGSLDTRVRLNSRDELGQLADNFNRMVQRLKTYMDRLVKGQRDLDEAQIRMMQAQLNPHFLCNTLDTMKWIGKMHGVPEISKMATDLADILRSSISTEEFVSLYEELELLMRYISIQRIRFPGRFTYTVTGCEPYLDCKIPKLILQPLVENAILHGLNDRENGNISVTVGETERGELYISVSDDGCGLPEDMLRAFQSQGPGSDGHLGLYNVNVILKKYYGADYGLRFANGAECGAVVTAVLPMQRREPTC